MDAHDYADHAVTVDRVELVDLVGGRVLWRRLIGADEPRPIDVPFPPCEPDWPTRAEVVTYTGDRAKDRIPVRLWYLVDGERQDVSQRLTLTRLPVRHHGPLTLAQALEVLRDTLALPDHRRYVGDVDAAAAVLANHAPAPAPPAGPGDEVAAAQLEPGHRIRYAPGPFETGEDVWTVTESRPDDTRPGQGFHRIVAERVDEHGQPNVRAGDHAPTDRFRLEHDVDVDELVDDGPPA